MLHFSCSFSHDLLSHQLLFFNFCLILVHLRIQFSTCHRPWNTRDTCWKLHRKPSTPPTGMNYKWDEGRGLHTAVQIQTDNSWSKTPLFNKEQLEHLYSLIGQSKAVSNSNSTCYQRSYSYCFTSSIWFIHLASRLWCYCSYDWSFTFIFKIHSLFLSF